MRKFRICMLCDALGLGGAETHVVTLANALTKEGHEVTVVSDGGALIQNLCGVRHKRIPFGRRWLLPYLFFSLWRFFRKEKFDVIHAHTRLTAFLCRPFVAYRLVTTAHWIFDTAFPKGALTTWGTETLAVSRDIADYLKKSYGVKEEHITLTVNGIDTALFAPQKKETGRVRIVYVSRMDEDRAHAAFCLLDAAVSLPHDAFTLTFLGDGDRFDALLAAAREKKARYPALSLEVKGGTSDVASFLREADVLVGVSRAALEGMAAGCAVILAGNEGYLSVFSPSDAARAEETNFCCRGTQKTTAALLLGDLAYLLSLPKEQLHEMGRANRAYVVQGYGEGRMRDDALSVYERICRREVVLCGYFGFRNVGDALLSRAFHTILQKEGYRRIRLLSAKCPSLRAFLALRRGYDFLLGGGNLLQDATSRRSLWFYLFCASRAKGRLLLYGGLGPLSPEGERRTHPFLARADAFFCRTVGDLLLAERLGAKTARLSADAVLSLPFPQKKKGERILLAFKAPKREEEPSLLAFTLSLCRKHGEERCFLYVMHPDDRAITRRLSRLCRIPFYDEGAEGFLSRLTECRAVVATRLHAGVAALAMGIPFLLGAAEEKCRFFVEDLHTLPCDASFCDVFSFSAAPCSLPPFAEIERACRLLQERI